MIGTTAAWVRIKNYRTLGSRNGSGGQKKGVRKASDTQILVRGALHLKGKEKEEQGGGPSLEVTLRPNPREGWGS